MPLQIFPYDSFERMLSGWLEGEDGRRRGLLPETVVIPSIAFGDYWRVAVAEARGICMGYDFLTPSGFLARLLGRERGMFWSKEQLAWEILPLVQEFAKNLGIVSSSSRDFFAVSGLLADMLDQYAHFRPEMLRAWAEGGSGIPRQSEEVFQKNEVWQRKLWRKLCERTKEIPPALAMGERREDEEFLQRAREEFPRVTVLGSGAVDPLLVEVLGLLDKAGCAVSVHGLLPTMAYLGDLRRRPTAVAMARKEAEEFSDDTGHPLLTSMGRHAVGTFLLLGSLDENYAGWPEAGGCVENGEARSLLGRLQADIRDLRAPEPWRKGADGSVRIHACYGARREMEVLRDEILRAFQEIEGLRPDEVMIVTPSLEIYAPLVHAVLEQGDSVMGGESGATLKVRVTERPPSAEDASVAVLSALLEMAAGGQYKASEILELLHLSTVQAVLGIKDDERGLEQVRGWIRRSGLTRGLGEEIGKPAVGSWRFARERLVAGLWLGDLKAARYPKDEDYILPVSDGLGGEGKLLQKFLGWFTELEQTMRLWLVPTTAQGWMRRLQKVLVTLMDCGEEGDCIMRSHWGFLSGLSTEIEVDAGTMLDWLKQATAEERRRTGFSGAVTMGQFRQLQNLPCRVLAMVGMQDAAFPRRGGSPAWNLLPAAPKLWDRNPGRDDRQMFLDSLLAPSERLIITGPTRNARTNDNEPFSACVDELLRVLATMDVAQEDVLVRHPLQPFSQEYFIKGDSAPLPRTFSKAYAQVARGIADAEGSHEERPFWAAKIGVLDPEIGVLDIALDDLVAFWKDPARAYLKAQGMILRQKEEDDEALDSFPVELGSLGMWGVRNAIVEGGVRGVELEQIKALYGADRLLPKGYLGDQMWKRLEHEAKILGKNIEVLRGELLTLSCCVDLAGNSYGVSPVQVKVSGQVWKTKDGKRLLAYQAGKANKPKHFLDPWIKALFAKGSGAAFTTVYLHGDAPKLEPSNTFEPQNLGGDVKALVCGYLLGQNRPLCYAPSTSGAIAKAMEKQPSLSLSNAIAKASDAKWFPSGHSDSPNEGEADAAELAWRDRNPFEEEEEWGRWVNKVAEPLQKWGGLP